jgi:PIN domain nuclease of toxin-antitoxin system
VGKVKRAYVDTSALLAIHFGERGGAPAARVLKAQDQIVSAALLVPEVLAALSRFERPLDQADRILRPVTLLALEGLRTECEMALRAGLLRGADLCHVATALVYAGPRARKAVTFVSLDDAQRAVAQKLGFPIAP